MSHFTVLVIGPNPEKQLAPYQENNTGDCPKEYLEFHDVEEKYRKEYEEQGIEKVIMPDGRKLYKWDKQFRIPGTVGTGSNTHKVPEELEIKEIPFKELYSSFEEFIKDWAGYKEKDEVTGKYGYWENPNAKWDWYSLGGHWRGFFKLKHPNRKTVLGSLGAFGNWPEFDSDQALKKDIDFEGMEEAEAHEAKEKYEMVERLFGGEIPKIEHRWKDIINEKNEKYNKMNHNEKREFYHTQPALMKIKELRKQCYPENTYPFSKKERKILVWLDLEDYQCSKEEYIHTAKAQAYTTFAVIKDGKWYDRREMGWWGCASNEMGEDEWCNKFHTLIHDLPDETLLSVYDYHI